MRLSHQAPSASSNSPRAPVKPRRSGGLKSLCAEGEGGEARTERARAEQESAPPTRWGAWGASVRRLALSAPLVHALSSSQLSAAPPQRFASLSPLERLTQLYGAQPRFTAQGEPLITLGLTWAQARLTLSSAGPLTLYVGADPKTPIKLEGRSFTLDVERLEVSQAAEVERWELLGERPLSQVTELSAIEEAWRARGVEQLVRFTSGAQLPGVSTPPATHSINPTDARAVALAHRASPQQPLADELSPLPTLTTLKRPAQGLMLVKVFEGHKRREQPPTLTLRARDLIWIEPPQGELIKLTRLEGRREVSTHYAGELYVVSTGEGSRDGAS